MDNEIKRFKCHQNIKIINKALVALFAMGSLSFLTTFITKEGVSIYGIINLNPIQTKICLAVFACILWVILIYLLLIKIFIKPYIILCENSIIITPFILFAKKKTIFYDDIICISESHGSAIKVFKIQCKSGQPQNIVCICFETPNDYLDFLTILSKKTKVTVPNLNI